MTTRDRGSPAATRRHRVREASASRVHLREARPEDLRELLELRRASRDFLEPWEPSEPDGTDRFGERWCARFVSPAKGERRVALLVCADEAGPAGPRQSASPGAAGGRLLGAISLFHIERGPIQSAQVAWWVGAAYARRGVTSRGLELALERAFGPLGLQRVEALILPENEPSRRLARRVGFQLEGLSRGYAELGGRRRDHERWSLTRAEWLARRGATCPSRAGSGSPGSPSGGTASR